MTSFISSPLTRRLFQPQHALFSRVSFRHRHFRNRLRIRCRILAKAQSQTSIPNRTPQLHPPSNNDSENVASLNTPPVAVLPLDVIQRIASGEVIHDFTTVVQELVENALDAKSTSIDVDIDFETRCVTVRDDGHGISSIEDFHRIALANATSKLSSLHQLHSGVSTLGFRGQALWAIAATAESLVVSSRPQCKRVGMSVRFAQDGQPVLSSCEPVAMSCGTLVVASRLPWSVASGRRAQAFRRCRQWLVRTSLCHPSVSFRLTRAGRAVWSTRAHNVQVFPSASHDDNGADGRAIAASLAREYATPLADFRHVAEVVETVGRIVVVIGLPSVVHSATNSSLVTAVNGRCVRLDSVNRAIATACSLKRGRYPVAFVGVETDGGNVNWNMCPSKTRMGFRDDGLEARIVSVVTRQLGNLLRSLPSHVFDKSSVAEDGLPSRPSVSSLLGAMYRKAGRVQSVADDDNVAASSPSPMFSANVVAQVLQTYILVEHSGGIMLIEQHVADERAIYERLLKCWQENVFVPAKEDILLPDSTTEEAVFRLSSLGFDVDMSEASGYVVRAVPEELQQVAGKELQRLLLQVGKDDVSIEEAAAAMSCRLAVKNGRVLDEKAMKGIVRGLMACENAHTCPHGRPIFHQIDSKELAGLFGRSWTPERAGSGGYVGTKDKANAGDLGMGDKRGDKRGFLYGMLDE